MWRNDQNFKLLQKIVKGIKKKKQNWEVISKYTPITRGSSNKRMLQLSEIISNETKFKPKSLP